MARLAPYKRILAVSKKPNMREFKMILKITGIGTVIIGGIGFAVFLFGRFIGGF